MFSFLKKFFFHSKTQVIGGQKMYVCWRSGRFTTVDFCRWGASRFSSVTAPTTEDATTSTTNKPNHSRLNWSIVSPFLSKKQKTVLKFYKLLNFFRQLTGMNSIRTRQPSPRSKSLPKQSHGRFLILRNMKLSMLDLLLF